MINEINFNFKILHTLVENNLNNFTSLIKTMF